MAASRPIVASDLPTIREVLNDENAFIVPPGDTVAIAAAIAEGVRGMSAGIGRAQRAREQVSQYTWDARARRIIEFLLGSK